jgi:hypothetical protein
MTATKYTKYKISSDNFIVHLNAAVNRTFHFTNHHLPAEMAVSYEFHVIPKYGKCSVGLTLLYHAGMLWRTVATGTSTRQIK